MRTDKEKWWFLIETTKKLIRVSDSGDADRIDKLLDLLVRYLKEYRRDARKSGNRIV